MGLADRDYMRERARERAESRGAVFNPWRRRRSNVGAVIVCGLAALGVALAFVFMGSGSGSPPAMGPMVVSTTKGTVQAPGSIPPPSGQPDTGEAFPETRTVQWGVEGQPIGGDLEQLHIWDVTGSKERKVVHVRGGPDSTFAMVYLHPGARVTIMVPAGRRYQVTATSGRTWKGSVERFGDTGTTVSFGMVDVLSGTPAVVAMGAPDQTASVVTADQF
jgi:hypothetical protein